jgi:hypothetical protein
MMYVKAVAVMIVFAGIATLMFSAPARAAVMDHIRSLMR